MHLATEKVLSKYRKQIIHREFILNRLADMTIDLYAMIAVISRVDSLLKEKGEKKTHKQLTICKTFCEEAWRRIRRNARQVDNNIEPWRQEISTAACEANGVQVEWVD